MSKQLVEQRKGVPWQSYNSKVCHGLENVGNHCARQHLNMKHPNILSNIKIQNTNTWSYTGVSGETSSLQLYPKSFHNTLEHFTPYTAIQKPLTLKPEHFSLSSTQQLKEKKKKKLQYKHVTQYRLPYTDTRTLHIHHRTTLQSRNTYCRNTLHRNNTAGSLTHTLQDVTSATKHSTQQN